MSQRLSEVDGLRSAVNDQDAAVRGDRIPLPESDLFVDADPRDRCASRRGSPSELSRGIAKRASLAAALVKAPKLLLATEPTRARDSATEASILAMLRQIADRGTTVVIATHDPAALECVDEAYFIESGRLRRPRRGELNLWLTEGTAFGENH